jgi:hypothetical protein
MTIRQWQTFTGSKRGWLMQRRFGRQNFAGALPS